MTRTHHQTMAVAIFACMPIFTTFTPAAAQSVPKPPPFYIAPAEQPSMTARQQEIMLIVRSADGYITEKLHNEFWSSIPFTGSELDQFNELLASTVDKVIGPSQKLGYETWYSAQLSLRAGLVVRSEALDSAIYATLNASNIPSYRKKAQEAADSVDRILTAAAEGTPLQAAHGPIFINEDLIAATLAGIEGGIHRTKILLNPTWDPSLQYFKHPELRISLLSAWPFTPSKSTISLPNGFVSDFYKLEQTVSEAQWAFIGFADYSQAIRLSKVNLSDPTTSVLENVQSGLNAVGATPATSPRAEAWRGYVSAEGSGYFSDGQERGFVSIRSVYLPQHEGFLVFTTVSLKSLSDAQQLLDVLEGQTQILR